MARAFLKILDVTGGSISRRRRHQFVPSISAAASCLEDRALLSGAGSGVVHHAAVAHGKAVASHHTAAAKHHHATAAHHAKAGARHHLQAPSGFHAVNVTISGNSSTSGSGTGTGTSPSGSVNPPNSAVGPIIFTANVRQTPRGLISRSFTPGATPAIP